MIGGPAAAGSTATTRDRERVQRAWALAWWLAVLVAPVAMVKAVPLEATQVQFLQECQAAWGQSISGWSGEIPDCSSATGLTCDPSGMIVIMQLRNYKLGGQIPNSLSSLKKLIYLDLTSNQLPGSIPATVTALSLLQYLWLFNNTLTGAIPADIGSLTSMITLYLFSNMLSGSVPSSITKLTALTILSLASNQLNGSIPADIGVLTKLTSIDFSSNQLSGSIPATISTLTQVSYLSLRSNQLTGSIPAELGSLLFLSSLSLNSNLLSGSVPSSITKLTALTFFSLANNQLTSSIPAGIGLLTKLVTMSLGSNQLTGSIPVEIGSLLSLASLSLASNQLNGSIPDNTGVLTKLRSIDVSSNQLSGSIPATISTLTQVSRLSLESNQLTGSIPVEIGSLLSLASLSLNSNLLSGSLPSAITKLTALTFLSLANNRLTSSIPAGIGLLTKLVAMSLASNQLNGSIPADIGALTKLTNIAVSSNQLSGSIPAAISTLAQLLCLDFSSNQLSGSIPATISTLTQVSHLDLSHNYLTGRALKLLAARTLYLSSNFLSGPLPDGACQPHSFDANCFTLPLGCALVPQRQEAACNAFCGVSSAAGAAAAAACGGHGVCYPEGASLAPTCLCDAGFVQFGGITCVAQGQNKNYSSSQAVLPPASILTRGGQRETKGNFTAEPVKLFVYEANQGLLRCGLQLAFHANFTFSLLPRSGHVGFNGLAFVISATDQVGSGAGVGYGGMDTRSMAVEFDTLQNKEHGDMSSHHVGLNVRGEDRSLVAVRSPFRLSNRKAYTAWVDYEPGDPGTIQVFLADSQEKPQQAVLEWRLALCEVLQGAVDQPAFFFGFVASTTVKPFQRHVILESTVDTGLPASPRTVTRNPAYGLQLSTNTYMPERASPFPRYVSADYRVAPSKQDSWVISDFHSWDSVPFLGWPVKDQRDCSSCWAFALVASVEAAYGIALNAQAPQLSVESLFAAMGLTSEADKCSTGGSPTEALERLLMLPHGGVTEVGAPKKKYPVHGFERTRFKEFVGLMLAVRRQPVVVHIEASALSFAQYDGTFKYQDPGCYTGRLNHVVLVIGYFILRNDGSQNRIAPPFWIIRNSWGVEWGDRGHMRMDIQGGDGVCGINVLPGIYPIVKIPKDPCGQRSFKGDGDLQPSMNPCGRFTCRANLRNNSNSCDCSIPNESNQPFVQAANGYGSQTCAYLDVCGSDLKNPCYVGACINDGKGSYSCICPPNYVESTIIDSFPTCDPANVTASTLAVSGSNWWCPAVLSIVGLSLPQFTQRNQGIDCNQALPRNMVLQLGNPLLVPCTAFFYTLSGDTCWSISAQLFLTTSNLTALNPGLDCSEPIKAGRSLCVERNATFAFTVPRCLRYGVLTAQDTCERLLLEAGSEDDPTGAGNVNAVRWAELYRNNPGLICSSVIPVSASAVGSNTGVQICLRAEYWSFVVGICKKGRQKPVSPSLTCSGAYSFYGGAANGAISKYYVYNEKKCVGSVGSKFICVP